jgi:hypothetical protein
MQNRKLVEIPFKKFVNYVWDNYTNLPCQKYAMAILETKIYYLKNFRAESDRWSSFIYCDYCITLCKNSLRGCTFSCNQSDTCKCNLCLSQPPTLKSLASRSVFYDLYHLDKFVLSATITYEQYRFAANSKKVTYGRLLPDTFPVITFEYFYRATFENERMHRKCCPDLQDEGTCFGSFYENFVSAQETVKSIVDYKEFWWCCRCDRPLIFKRLTCSCNWHYWPYTPVESHVMYNLLKGQCRHLRITPLSFAL